MQQFNAFFTSRHPQTVQTSFPVVSVLVALTTDRLLLQFS